MHGFRLCENPDRQASCRREGDGLLTRFEKRSPPGGLFLFSLGHFGRYVSAILESMQTCPACNGSKTLDGDPIDEAYATYRVMSNPLLAAFYTAWTRRHPEDLDRSCRTCSGTGTVDEAGAAKHKRSGRRSALAFAGFVLVLLTLWALAGWWLHGQFEAYN